MGKFLHRYRKYDDFQKDYGTGPQVTAFTVVDAYVYQECSDGEPLETEEYNGKYVFDREIVVPSITFCGNQSPVGTNVKVRVFKKGDTEVMAMYSEDRGWEYEWGFAYIVQDFDSMWQAGDAELELALESLESFEWGTPNYREPWVSYTTDNLVSKFTGRFSSGDFLGFEAEYVGECDWETRVEPE